VSALEAGALKTRTTQVGTTQVSTSKVTLTQISLTEAGTREVDPLHPCTSEADLVEDDAAEILAIQPDACGSQQLQSFITGITEAHTGLAATENQFHGIEMVTLTPLTSFKHEQKTGCHDAQGLKIADAHHATSVMNQASWGHAMLPALFPAVNQHQH